jgi:hypothetical protein
MHPDDAKAGGNNLKLGWQLLGHFGHIDPKLPTIKARDSVAEGYEAGLRRQSPQIGTIVKGIVDGDQRVVNDLFPTPAVAHVRNHDEDLDGYMQRRQDYVDGKAKGMPGASLGVAVRLTAEGIDWQEPTLMPTPTARDFRDGQADYERDGVVQTDTVSRAIFNSGEVLLPTTTASDWKGPNRSGGKSASANMLAAKVDLLPTTTTNGNERKGPGYSSAGILQELEIANGILPKEYLDWDHASKKVSSIPEQKSEKKSLDETIIWGKFAPAIERWEAVIDREVPAPTKPDGKDGNHRLSAEFTEWMMGLPAGWVTDPELGLNRNEQLKLCGNGVVPQQAALALTRLLTGVNIDSAPRIGGGSLMFPTPTVSDIYTDNLASTQQKPSSMHSVTLAQAAKWVNTEEKNER